MIRRIINPAFNSICQTGVTVVRSYQHRHTFKESKKELLFVHKKKTLPKRMYGRPAAALNDMGREDI
jgi:hypothetical protein